jgi:8-amino-7-oxononanoate synthase
MLSKPLQQIDRTFALWENRKLSYFGGCDYYRLSSHPAILAAAQTAIEKQGLNVSASRSTTGNHLLYERLEQELGQFFQVESAALLSNGYLANLALGQALAGEFSKVFIDEQAHSSLKDAASFLKCPAINYKHRDGHELRHLLRKEPSDAKCLIMTDGVFSCSGALAPLGHYLEILRENDWLWVDDAHGAGVLGPNGRGALEELGASSPRVIQTVTLSKALGVCGGAVLGPRQIVELVQEKSGIFSGNTPLPLPLAAAGLEALKIIGNDSAMRRRLRQNTLFVKSTLAKQGLSFEASPAPIFSIPFIERNGREKTTAELIRLAIYPSCIQYPGGPREGFFRFSISSEHTSRQLENLVQALTTVFS